MKKRMLVLGDKESFLTRVMVSKTQSAGVGSSFAQWNVNDINSKWDEISLVTLYMDTHKFPAEDAIHFLIEKMEEEGAKIILVGEKAELKRACDRVPGDLVYLTFERPLNNDEYIKAITEFYKKFEEGEFKKNILIVDDDPGYLNLVRDWLKGKYKINMASSGLQAIKWLGKNKADLILLDHEMPVTTGPQVLEMLRSEEETRDIPVIFLTGKSDKKSVMEVVDLKPEGYFLKTIGREELTEKLDAFFASRR